MSPCCSPFMSNGTMTEGDRNEVLLLQLSDEFLLVVQLISQAADLLLMSLTVGVDLLLHGFLNTHKMHTIHIQLIRQDTSQKHSKLIEIYC